MSLPPRSDAHLAPLNAAARAVRDFVATHHKTLAATVAVALTGFGVTAFGIAPLAPDAAELPRRIVIEAVGHEDVSGQLEALADLGLKLSRSDTTRASDTADSLFKRLGVIDAEAAQFLRSDRTAQRLFAGRAGKMVSAQLDDEGKLQSLVARYADPEDNAPTPSRFTRLTITRPVEGAFVAKLETAPLEGSTRLAGGTIKTSLFAASDEADIPDAIAVQMAEMFSADVDFHRELRKGDSFSVVYETMTADGEPISWNQGSGRVLAAEFVNNGKTYQAVWYGPSSGGKGGYYDFNGESKHRAFLASPMEFSRVTSGFAMRFHPIMQTWRQHLGVDYGAPTGTPVRAVGEGTVEFAGWQNGYGNVVQIQHNGARSTLYGHLSRIDVRRGQRIEQGQRVGAVGATGWATGPHLHFEFRVNGQHQDPLRIAKAAETVPLAAAERSSFAQVAGAMKTQLQVADELRGRADQVE
ncbi:MAG TPA: peptidoglycan DD-metalloendopeptidase family protein [Ideonella sp.]|jgi:murein DD-endopeptidase MepM/ murein hydrolase activator NlpD|nr:peptidoglycan DD-metalloendopeptidase family protein [Ideonella sp.]